MTKPHRATPEQWESIERYADDNGYDACFLELRARIEALEDAQQPPQDKLDRLIALDRDDPAGSLVERVAWLIAKRFSESRPGTDCLPFGRDVILAVAAWFRTERDSPETAAALEQEAN